MSDQSQEKTQEKKGPLSGVPIYRRGEGYITATAYHVDDDNNIVESVTAIDAHGHQHPISQQKVSKGREKHILDLHRERLKMIEKHQKYTDKQLEEMQAQKADLAQQKEAITTDVKYLEERTASAGVEKKGEVAEEKAVSE